jgi:hypothetical protein
MDYGERQDRAEMLVKALRAAPNKTEVVWTDWYGEEYTARRIAEHIEDQSEYGVSIVAIAGFVLQAMLANVQAKVETKTKNEDTK